MNNVAVFAHYDKDNIIDDYVLDYLSKLSKVADVIFVSDNNLSAVEIEKIKPHTIHNICKHHGEYDFGSYKRGFQYIQVSIAKYDNLIFCNDSCYCLTSCFMSMFAKMNSDQIDFWGITKNTEIAVHVQSCFLVFSKHVFMNQCFIDFVGGVVAQKNKEIIIKKYEVGLSQMLLSKGFRFDVLSDSCVAINLYCLGMVNHYDAPFVKVEFFKDNPRGVANVYELFQQMPIASQKRIFEHLSRVGDDFLKVWFYKWQNNQYVFLHRKLLRIEILNQKNFLFVKAKIFGVSLIKLPIYCSWFIRRKMWRKYYA